MLVQHWTGICWNLLTVGIESKGIIITAVHLVHGGNEKIFFIEFLGGVSGNIEALDVLIAKF